MSNLEISRFLLGLYPVSKRNMGANRYGDIIYDLIQIHIRIGCGYG